MVHIVPFRFRKFACDICNERYRSRRKAEKCEQKITKPYRFELEQRVIVRVPQPNGEYKKYKGIVKRRKRKSGTQISVWKSREHYNNYSVERIGKVRLKWYSEDRLRKYLVIVDGEWK